MDARIPYRPDWRVPPVARVALQRAMQVGHRVFSSIGIAALAVVLTLWLQPQWRAALAARLLPALEAAAESGPAVGRLLIGRVLPQMPPYAPGVGVADDPLVSASVANGERGFDGALDAHAADGLLEPRVQHSLAALAEMIPSERIAADARDDRALVSWQEQSLVANFLARRYRVAEEPVANLVQASFATGREVGLDPLLLLAVMAIESGFNPYAESGVGAQGLMQVMAKVHSDKFGYFGGGPAAALQPVTNIKVGALILKDCIARGGSLAAGLRLYNGATSTNDGGYSAKVMAERARLRDVARGRSVPVNAPQTPAPVLSAANAKPTAVAAPVAAHPEPEPAPKTVVPTQTDDAAEVPVPGDLDA